MCEVQINGKAEEMMIETGASVNLVNGKTRRRINSDNTSLKPAHTKIYSYGSKTSLPLLGTFSATVTCSSISTNTQLHVVKGNKAGNLLSYNTGQKLNVVTISITATVTAMNNSSPEIFTRRIQMSVWRHTKSTKQSGKVTR